MTHSHGLSMCGDQCSRLMSCSCRKKLEQSNAALCPTVAYQLTGAKKIQQDLATGDTLERFLSADEAKLIRRCFAGKTCLPCPHTYCHYWLGKRLT